MTAVSDGKIRELEKLQREYLKLFKRDEVLAQALMGREDTKVSGWMYRGEDGRMAVRGKDVPKEMERVVREYNEKKKSLVRRLAWLIGELETIRPFGKKDSEAILAIVNGQLKERGYPPIGSLLERPVRGPQVILRPTFSATEKLAYRRAVRAYRRWRRTDELERLLLMAMTEALYRWIVKLGGGKTMTLKRWARESGASVNAVRNRARRGTIPAFRENGRWVVVV